MSTFETLSIMLMVIAIIISLLLEVVKSQKKQPPQPKVAVTLQKVLKPG